MGSSSEMVVSIKLDTTEIERQLADLKSALECVPDNISGLLLGGIGNLLDNIVLRYVPATSSTGNINEITFKVEIVGTLDECAAAIRTHNFNINGVAH